MCRYCFWVCSGVLSDDRDYISKQDMRECMKLSYEIVAPGGTCITFCSEYQQHRWRKAAVAVGFDVQHLITVVRQEFGKKRGFRPHTRIIPICEYALVCKKTVGKSLNFVNFDVDECGSPHISGRHQTYLVNGNVFANHKYVKGIFFIMCSGLLLRSYANALSGEAYLPENETEMLRREQKSVGTLAEFLQRYTYPGALVVDMFSGTGSTAVACVLMQRRFIGCDVDADCVAAGKVRLVDLFENGSNMYSKLLDKKSGTPVDWRSERVLNYTLNQPMDDKTPILVKDTLELESAKVGLNFSKFNDLI